MRRALLRSFKRFKASKLFLCFACGGSIEVGSYYWRFISKFKYDDRCFVRMLLRSGFCVERGRPSGRIIIREAWSSSGDLSLEGQLLVLSDIGGRARD